MRRQIFSVTGFAIALGILSGAAFASSGVPISVGTVMGVKQLNVRTKPSPKAPVVTTLEEGYGGFIYWPACYDSRTGKRLKNGPSRKANTHWCAIRSGDDDRPFDGYINMKYISGY